MHNNKYLYGTDDVPEVSKELINTRLALLNKQLNLVISTHYLERDNVQVNAIIKARKFWENINGK